MKPVLKIKNESDWGGDRFVKTPSPFFSQVCPAATDSTRAFFKYYLCLRRFVHMFYLFKCSLTIHIQTYNFLDFKRNRIFKNLPFLETQQCFRSAKDDFREKKMCSFLKRKCSRSIVLKMPPPPPPPKKNFIKSILKY